MDININMRQDSPGNEPSDNKLNSIENAVFRHTGESVDELVKNIASEDKLKLGFVTKGLCQAIEEGKIRLVDLNPPKNLLGYLFSIYSLWYWIVIGFIGVGYTLIRILPLGYPYDYLRYFVGAVFVLFVPGYTLLEMLYPKTEAKEGVGRVLTSIVLSFVIVGLGGMIPILTVGTILLDPLVTVLVFPVIGFGALGVWRKYEYFVLARLALKNLP